MPLSPDSSSPAALRYSRTPKTKVAVSGAGISAAGLVTHASGAMDPYQNGDLCTIVETAAATPLSTAGPLAATGGTFGIGGGTLYRIVKVSPTTTQLIDVSTGAAPTIGPAAITIGASLQFGGLGTEILSRNIVPAGSVAGGGFGGPLD